MQLTIAINRYDRHVPFFNGTVSPPKGIAFTPLEVGESSVYRDGTNRHERMLTELAFDVAEMSLSSFIMAVARDPNLPLVGIPVFPRRFFSVGQIYVNADAGIRTPGGPDRPQGRPAFLSNDAFGPRQRRPETRVWRRMGADPLGLHAVGGRPRRSWLGCESGRHAPRAKTSGMMLCEGEIDALISPQPRASMLARPDRYRRLFPDAHAEEVRYFRKYGFYPIMHLVVLKRDLAERFPELPRELQRMFEDAKRLAYEYYADSNYSLLVDGRMLYEQQEKDFGADPWPNGFTRNRKNLEQFIGYSHDQRLISSLISAAQLFHPSTYDT